MLTPDEQTELAQVETAFDEAGDRGAELAVRIDALRAKRVELIVEDTTPIRRAILDATDGALAAVCGEIVSARRGDSNDAEHDALFAVAELFGLDVDTKV